MQDLSIQEMLILQILNEDGARMSRLDVIAKLGNSLKKSTIDFLLRNLVKRGYIVYRRAERDDLGRFSRRFYWITDQGVSTLVNQLLAEMDL
ncbi:MAG: BlaI/MecI/CopY family transcriptional regulator [Patescibacteria group bacterium]|nr:BlaI/MecI/CopY family transcriptional regulator [Patescibacteria group bacterium]